MRPKPTRRQSRYGHLSVAWRWRTTDGRLSKMEARRKELGLSKTEYLERCVDLELAQARKEQDGNQV